MPILCSQASPAARLRRMPSLALLQGAARECHEGVGRRQLVVPEKSVSDSHSYENRCHVFCAYTDGECEILDTLLCVKGGSISKRRRSRSLACKPLCTNKLQKNCMCCSLPKPNCQTACFSYTFPGWCYLYMAKELYS